MSKEIGDSERRLREGWDRLERELPELKELRDDYRRRFGRDPL
jgi:hypothetical protein